MDEATLARAEKATTALNEGRYNAALKIAKAALKSAPGNAYLANLAGLALVQTGNLPPAAPFFLTAWRSDPNMVEAPRNLAQVLGMLGQTDKALEVLAKARASWPHDRELTYLNASTLHGAGRFADAIAAASTGLAQAPASAALHTLRALAHEQSGSSAAAELDFRKAVQLDPTDVETRRAYAQFLAFHAQADAAFDHVTAGLATTPDHEGLLLLQASLHHAHGNQEAAKASLNTILTLYPEHALALNSMAFLVDASDAADLQKKIAAVLKKATTPRDHKVLLGFAQAHLARLGGHPDTARLLAKANGAAAKAMPYDSTAVQVEQDRLMAPFAEAMTRPTPQTDTPVPIFIVGLIRSGTTLLEQTLSQHPTTVGLGELPTAGHLAVARAQAFAQDGTLADGAEFAAQYRAVLPTLPQGTTHFVDKMPENFRHIGYLFGAFPNATVIEVQRDPRDVALSMWASFFPTHVHSYANAVPDIAQHLNHYARVMHQWRALFAGRIHTVTYEDLVRDFEPTARHAASLCGLEWHPDMARPERSTSPVLTASVSQVRRTVHTNSVGKWMVEEDLLAPLVRALDPSLWPALSDIRT